MGRRRPVWKLPAAWDQVAFHGRRVSGRRSSPCPLAGNSTVKNTSCRTANTATAPTTWISHAPVSRSPTGALAGRYPWAARRSALLGPPCSPAANATAASAPTPGPTR